ncbi:MAG: peptidoglycan editing factor PgeF [Alphaproteobacteria bacterium]|nr:peptidoglycan editing factor PgeF [Alphaproteobacteria bacterium]MBU1280427.1 peptidoglycan editing factor PgeF [Alphaproteobacteria bacterium]MBU1572432.1 peptidoglycan editing factor PgeF [Alphaproteobacteria bacterium]MBU1827322.1 peptidoglycan editing factor PgeF [Alphaproteobacteria bacterium]MBU2079356.1 peptidoglycan editing factor PgeF [Alphaproteobacteria bacterium]
MSLEIITSDALDGVTHGFFTRKGGASSGVFEGLNCGLGSTDQSDIVKINRARVAKAMDLTPDQLCAAHQIHSADVAIVTGPQSGDAPKADALVTNQPGLALVILTADCQPVLFADRDTGVIGAAHAGWKGAAAGVLEATIEAMETLGAKREAITAVIGPSISQRAYEVGPEFFEDFYAENPIYARFFTNGTGDRYLFDLPAFGLYRLREAGVGHAEWTRHCTYFDPSRFYSYRRSVHRKEADYGRLISVIRL